MALCRARPHLHSAGVWCDYCSLRLKRFIKMSALKAAQRFTSAFAFLGGDNLTFFNGHI